MADVSPRRTDDVTPGTIADFTFRWDRWLGSGRTLTSAVYSILPTGPTIGATVLSQGNTYATAEVSGCTKGTRYVLSCLATASDGKAEEGRVEFYCRDDGET